MVDAIDQSWDTTAPEHAKAAGVQVVSGYLSHTPSKNWTRAKIDAYHREGIGVILNWESAAGRALLGAAAGRADARAAIAQAVALGAPTGRHRTLSRFWRKGTWRTIIYFSCDRDVTSGQFPTIDAYYKAARAELHAAGFGLGAYGEASLIRHLSSAGITDAEWQTYAWSGGVLDPAADLYQYQNGQTLGGAAVDFNRIIHRSELGAWWPGDEGDMTPDECRAVVRDEINRVLMDKPGKDGQPVSVRTLIYNGVNRVLVGADGQAHSVNTLVWDNVEGVTRLASDMDKRVAALQASLAELTALVKAQSAKETVTGDIPVTITGTGTAHLGGQS